MRKPGLFLLIPPVLFLASCAGTLSTVATAPATVAYTGGSHRDLTSLPAPKQKIPVSVYNFRDQTGQYKPLAGVTSFSTAVTQGGTSMLVQALSDSKWFIPVEREGLQDLLTERKIIRSALETNGQAGKGNEKPVNLPPLGFAEILIEGGITAYETNILTGGFGAKYFGAGGNIDYRVDRVTIYLRAVDVATGRILKTVSTSKSILSRGIDIGVFRFVSFKRLLEAETGITTNEPAQLCVLDAIEKAVTALVIEGVADKVWQLSDSKEVDAPVIARYFREKSGILLDPEGKQGKETPEEPAGKEPEPHAENEGP